MSQRLHHILSNLQQAILVLTNSEAFQDEKTWERIFEGIQESYTMQEEKDLYLAIKQGEFVAVVGKLQSRVPVCDRRLKITRFGEEFCPPPKGVS